MKKKVLWLVAILTMLVCLQACVSEYFIHYALRPKMGAYDEQSELQSVRNGNSWTASWLDSLQEHHLIRDTFIVSGRGERMHAYYVYADSTTDRVAVLVHGYTDCGIHMMHIGYLYNHDLHYNILLPDLHYHGKTGGRYVQMGWKDRLDVMDWMAVADSLFGGNTRMVVHGISMGGATTMMVSGEQLPSYVRAFVDDCGYTSVWDQFAKELKGQFGLPPFPLLTSTNLLCKMQLGWSFREASSLKQVKKCQLPMLFIHGDEDDYVPTRMVYPLYNAKPEPKELWIVPGAKHAESYSKRHEEYTQHVKDFLARYLDNI